MSAYRKLTTSEIEALTAAGTTAEDWNAIEVTPDFQSTQLSVCRLEGQIYIGRGAQLRRSTVRNYRIGEQALVEGVAALECRHASSFGNGVAVATINECAGRTVHLYDRLTAQTAYILALYRHRPEAIAAIERMIDHYAQQRLDTIGTVEAQARITGAGAIREVHIGRGAVIDGCSLLENGTICAGAHIGIDVQARDFIAAEESCIAGGTLLERCFVGECCTLDKHFTAVDSLFFANSHCENGEAVSIFAGPYTVSHHKSSLLIAGLFSFFNAGSGANQSNHLFKSGAVHQSIHRRGCKFGSGTYIMAPAAEGPFTLVLGRHAHHHDTSAFPFSYLVEQDGRSALMPGANLISYGTVRDIEKWPARDHRTVRRDRINFEPHNPYLTGCLIEAVNTLNTLAEANPDADSYIHKHVTIKSVQLNRGLKLYNKAIVASLGAMLPRGEAGDWDGTGRWDDLAGQYVPRREVQRILHQIEQGAISSLDGIDQEFAQLFAHYDHYARSWAEGVLEQLLGHTPSAEEIAEAVAAGEHTREALGKTAQEDRQRDCSEDMAVGYGIDTDSEEERMQDYYIVRGLR